MDIKQIAKIINEKGGNLYLVGGAVRDQILNRKNNDEDYEIVLEKYIKKSSTQSLVDFYLVNTKTLEVTDQQRDYW